MTTQDKLVAVQRELAEARQGLAVVRARAREDALLARLAEEVLAAAVRDDPKLLFEADFSTDERKKLAKQGKAMPHGGYPIRNVGDLKNAIKAIGRAGNRQAAIRWIKKRAKALGATNQLPEAWQSA